MCVCAWIPGPRPQPPEQRALERPVAIRRLRWGRLLSARLECVKAVRGRTSPFELGQRAICRPTGGGQIAAAAVAGGASRNGCCKSAGNGGARRRVTVAGASGAVGRRAPGRRQPRTFKQVALRSFSLLKFFFSAARSDLPRRKSGRDQARNSPMMRFFAARLPRSSGCGR